VFDDTVTWGLVQDGKPHSGVLMTTNNGAPPFCYPSGRPRYSTVEFTCSTKPTPSLRIVSQDPCDAAPGYYFQLLTPLACVGANVTCSYTESAPCIVGNYSVYAVSGDRVVVTLDSQSQNYCGSLVFEPILEGLPAGTCELDSQNHTVMMAYFGLIIMPEIMEILSDPAIYFWDTNLQAPVLGSMSNSSIRVTW